MNTPDSTYTVLKHNLSRYLPVRIVLRHEDETYTGRIEESFSMGYSKNRVRIWWSGKAYSFLGEHIIDGEDDATLNAREGDIVVDPLSEDCPVEIDWDAWISATDKYGKRNAPFKVKDPK